MIWVDKNDPKIEQAIEELQALISRLYPGASSLFGRARILWASI